MDITDLQSKLITLIESRSNSRTVLAYNNTSTNSVLNSPLRSIGEGLLNRFAFQLSDQAMIAEQRENIQDELVESIVSSLVIAGMIGVDLEKELSTLITLLESVSYEAS